MQQCTSATGLRQGSEMEFVKIVSVLDGCFLEIAHQGYIERDDRYCWFDPVTGIVIARGYSRAVWDHWTGDCTEEYIIEFPNGGGSIEGDLARQLLEHGRIFGEYDVMYGLSRSLLDGEDGPSEDDPDLTDVEYFDEVDARRLGMRR